MVADASARAVFLDRDGVLNISEVRNGKPYAPRRLDDFHVYPECLAALTRLRQAGFLLFVVTNQPDIGNKLVEQSEVDAMNAQLTGTLPITHVFMCPHSQTEGCGCRKPRPGMLIEAAERYGVDLASSFMVGDRYGDIAAGYAAGCRTVFIDRGYTETSSQAPDWIVASLTEAVDVILGLL